MATQQIKRYVREMVHQGESSISMLDLDTTKEEIRLDREIRTGLDDYEDYSVYLLRCVLTGLTKIGFSSQVRERVISLRTMSPTQLDLVAIFAGDRGLKNWFHRRFDAYRHHGEWFKLPPSMLLKLQGLKQNQVCATNAKVCFSLIRDLEASLPEGEV